MKRIITLGIAALLMLGASAKANFIAFYVSNTGTEFRYTLRFTVNQVGEVLRSGDTVTLYDLGIPADIVSVSEPTSPAGLIAVSQQLKGITPAALVGAAALTDSPGLQNITFTYVGPDLTASQDFTGIKLTAAKYSSLILGKQAGATEVSFPLANDSSFYQAASLRQVLIPGGSCCGPPQTPEPASLLMVGLGVVGLFSRRNRPARK